MTGAILSTGSPQITMGKGNFGATNFNSGTHAFVAGQGNSSVGNYSTIGGGLNSVASANQGTVGGGESNTASGLGWATVAGGRNNMATFRSATVSGGEDNQANGAFAWAGGRGTRSNHAGAFIWSDSGATGLTSSANNQFGVLASGGLWFGSTGATVSIPAGQFIATSTGAHLTTGGAWTNSSDRNLKDSFNLVDPVAILQGVVDMPITTWSYLTEPGVRRMGPVAQDFYASFGLGQTDRAISTVDADGVALASIQGLHTLLVQRDQQIAAQNDRIDQLERQLQELIQRMANVEANQ